MYRELHPPIKCSSCKALPKAGGTFTQRSPNTQLVSEYLNDECTLQPHDLLCLACYKVYLSIFNFYKSQLQSLIDQLPINIKLVRPSTNKLTCAILTTVVRFAECINEKAMLLSNACAVFMEAYTGETDIDSLSSVILEIENSVSITKFTSRWLLHQLILHP